MKKRVKEWFDIPCDNCHKAKVNNCLEGPLGTAQERARELDRAHPEHMPHIIHWFRLLNVELGGREPCDLAKELVDELRNVP